ncbi:unnamed protein product [Caenorhabditis brenneri]
MVIYSRTVTFNISLPDRPTMQKMNSYIALIPLDGRTFGDIPQFGTIKEYEEEIKRCMKEINDLNMQGTFLFVQQVKIGFLCRDVKFLAEHLGQVHALEAIEAGLEGLKADYFY